MKAARFEVYGDPGEVLQLAECADPGAPGQGQVRVRMLAASVDPADLLLIQGVYGERPALPHVPGLEGVGRIEAVGEGVDGLTEGTLVLPVPGSNWQEIQCLGADEVLPLPSGLDVEQAAMLKVNPPTARLLLGAIAPLEAGDWVVQNAANSAVGRLVVQMARRRGVHTLNLVRRDSAAAALDHLGADAVLVDDGSGDAEALAARAAEATGGGRVPLGLDAVGGDATGRLAGLLSGGGVIANYGVLSGAPCTISPADLIFRGITLRGFWLMDWFQSAEPRAVAELFGELAGEITAGTLHTEVAARYPLADLHDAIGHARRGGRDGKVLLRME